MKNDDLIYNKCINFLEKSIKKCQDEEKRKLLMKDLEIVINEKNK